MCYFVIEGWHIQLRQQTYLRATGSIAVPHTCLCVVVRALCISEMTTQYRTRRHALSEAQQRFQLILITVTC